ncbi:hypothetical protein M3G15_12600 [Paenibacillus sp. p3-SID1389]|nr:hypothetical protein [Paenibacillus sp. p3-SID1389]MCT2195981.1 hypothetical protein [Paenibacillus sp. p3-SID1389]
MSSSQTLRDRFDVVYLEDPTIEFTLHIFRRAGYRISPVAIRRRRDEAA